MDKYKNDLVKAIQPDSVTKNLPNSNLASLPRYLERLFTYSAIFHNT